MANIQIVLFYRWLQCYPLWIAFAIHYGIRQRGSLFPIIKAIEEIVIQNLGDTQQQIGANMRFPHNLEYIIAAARDLLRQPGGCAALLP